MSPLTYIVVANMVAPLAQFGGLLENSLMTKLTRRVSSERLRHHCCRPAHHGESDSATKVSIGWAASLNRISCHRGEGCWSTLAVRRNKTHRLSRRRRCQQQLQQHRQLSNCRSYIRAGRRRDRQGGGSVECSRCRLKNGAAQKLKSDFQTLSAPEGSTGMHL